MSRTPAGLLRAVSVLMLLMAATLLLRVLPIAAILARFQAEASLLGAVGLIAYGGVYVVAALAFIPGSALTLGAGAVFGPLRGLAVVSVASTTAAALAFLIARHLARRRVQALARSHPRFRDVDRAIAQGGWRVVALMRLSPVLPYSASNYLFGLTGVGFWPYVLASWGAMLPGTLLYVYLGHAGRAAAGGARTPGEWILLALGLAATGGVSVYLTRLARRSASGQRSPAQAPVAPDLAVAAAPAELPVQARPAGWRLPVAAVAALAFALWARANADQVRYAFGPSAVSAVEAYASSPGSVVFDHSRFDALLRAHVDGAGLVDYAGLKAAQPALDAYLDALAAAPFAELGRDEKLALLINAYNALTLRLVLDHWPLGSIRDIPSERRWDDRRWVIAGETLSLNQIEHERIRPKFREPRVHFALVCAARGCPPLRAEAYGGERLESQLAHQARRVHTDGRWLRFDPASKALELTELYKWYGSDFGDGADSVPEYVARYVPGVRVALDSGRPVQVRWIPYDWSLNGRK